MLKRWDDLPPDMKNESVRPYYEALRRKRLQLFCKRAFDIVVSLLMLAVLLAPLLLIALLVVLDSRGGPLYRQTRVTRCGRTFKIIKFRSMRPHAGGAAAQITVANDPRVTRAGAFLRKTRLDELPQLLNVLAGSMSFVGVRAEVPKYVAAYSDEMRATLLLPAGVTSPTLVEYPDEDLLIDPDGDIDRQYIDRILPEKMPYDLRYIRNFSLWLDVRTLLVTVLSVIGRQRAEPPAAPKTKQPR